MSIQIVRTLTEEEASSDDEDDDDYFGGIEIVRDKPLPYPEVCLFIWCGFMWVQSVTKWFYTPLNMLCHTHKHTH